MKRLRVYAAALLLLGASTMIEAATFNIRSTDGAGEGLNDTTPVTPVGGNSATTLGQARMNVLLEAARIWGLLLQSNVPIQVDAGFDSQTCSATSGTLGAAGPRAVYRNFGGGVSPDIYYVSALADALAGANQSTSATTADIGATFNSSVDGDPVCLGGRGFYYGFDHNRGTKVDLLLVVLHEFAHGLGFTSQVNLSNGSGFVGNDGVERFDIYTHKVFDEQFGSAWPNLTGAQRVESAAHSGALTWNGALVNAQIGRYSQGISSGGRIRLYAPATVASGSSVSHFDSAITPSVLMEPNLPTSIVSSSTDITSCALQDIGWTVSACPHDATNRTPIATPQSVGATEDTPVTITLSGTDPDNSPLTYAIATQPANGTLSALSTTAPRTVIYTPNANYNGGDSFTFTVNDGSVSSAPASVTLSIAAVNDAPDAQNISVVAATGQATDITLVAPDAEGDRVTFSVVGNPTHGTLNGTGATLTYRSVGGYSGADSFTYMASDGIASSAPATVTITVATAAQANASDSGGGGSMSAWLVAALIGLLLGARARKRISS